MDSHPAHHFPLLKIHLQLLGIFEYVQATEATVKL